MSTQLAKVVSTPFDILAEWCGVPKEEIEPVLRNTVLKPTKSHTPTMAEIAIFVGVCNQYKLNPFLREIHAFVDQTRGVIPMVGIDGWTKLAVQSKRYDGCEFEEVIDNAGIPVCTKCTMHVKGMDHPISVSEWFNECKRDTQPWRQMPKRMLRHKAFMQSCRYAFSLSGIFDEDEARDIIANTPNLIDVSDIPAEGSRTENIAKRLSSKRPKIPAPPPPPDETETNLSVPPPYEEVQSPVNNSDPAKPLITTIADLANAVDGDTGTTEGTVEKCQIGKSGKQTWFVLADASGATIRMSVWGDKTDEIKVGDVMRCDYVRKGEWFNASNMSVVA